MAIKLKQIAFQSKIASASVLICAVLFGFSVEVDWSQHAENNVPSSNAKGDP